MFDSLPQEYSVVGVLAYQDAYHCGFRIERSGDMVLVFAGGGVAAVNKEGYVAFMRASEVRNWEYARGALAQLVEQIGPHR